jgi:dTDP-4-dehydrorhamnose reductase
MAIILVTGASGQLGNELKIVSKNYPGYEFIFTDIPELDITGKKEVKKFITNNPPDWIINCAAYNSVDKAETESEKAMLINSDAVSNISEAIKGSECKFIHFSSDYVFDGKSNIPYNENSVPAPQGAYGRSKLEGEKAALTHHGSMIIRTSWLYSSFGSNFVKTILKKATEYDSLKVVYDQTGTPTYAADLAEAIMNIVAGVIRNQISFKAGIYHYSNEGVCSWYDFASEIVKESGIKCQVYPILTKDYPAVAKRPFYSVLDKSKIKENYNLEIPHWRSSLQKCIKQFI